MRSALLSALVVCSAAIPVGCGSGTEQPPTGPIVNQPPAAPAPPPAPPISPRLRVWIDPGGPFVGMSHRIRMDGFGADGRPLNTADVVLTLGAGSSAVAQIVRPLIFDALDPRTGERTALRSPLLRFHSTGPVTLHASLGALRDSLTVNVLERPPLDDSALTVENFMVTEYRVSCGDGCGQLYYVPTLRVREPTGARAVTIIALEFGLGWWSTGLCGGSQLVPPGNQLFVAGYVYGEDTYGLLTARSIDQSLGNGPAFVEMIVQYGSGVYGTVRAEGVVDPLDYPFFNVGAMGHDLWSC